MSTTHESSNYVVVSTPHNREAKKITDYKLFVSFVFLFFGFCVKFLPTVSISMAGHSRQLSTKRTPELPTSKPK